MKQNQAAEKRINELVDLQRLFFLQILALVAIVCFVIILWLPLTDHVQESAITIELVILIITAASIFFYSHTQSFKRRQAKNALEEQREAIDYLQQEINKAPERIKKDIRKSITTILSFDAHEQDKVKQWAIDWFEKLKKDAEETKVRIKKRLENSDGEIIKILQMEAEMDEVSDEGEEILLSFLSGIHNVISDRNRAKLLLRPLLEEHALIYMRKNIQWHEDHIRLLVEYNKELVNFLKKE